MQRNVLLEGGERVLPEVAIRRKRADAWPTGLAECDDAPPLPYWKLICTSSEPRAMRVDANTARKIAGRYLLLHVGDLLGPGTPRQSGGYWVMPIILSNVFQGEVGEVGTISVDAESGEILFSEDDRIEVEVSAESLAGAASP